MIYSVNPSLVRSIVDVASATKTSENELKKLNARLNAPPPPAPSEIVADNNPSNQYATLEKNGSVIATVYKSGLIVTSNGLQVPSDLAMTGKGTSLADTRLKQMMEMHGGAIKYVQDAKIEAASKMASSLFSAQLAIQR